MTKLTGASLCDAERRGISYSPVSFSRNKPVNAFLLDSPDIFFVCIPVDRLQELKLFTPIRFAALPAPNDLFFLAALPDLTEWRAATVSAPFLAPELHHGPEEFVTFLVIRKRFPKRCIRDRSGKFFIPCVPKFFPEIARKVSDLPGIPVTIKAAETAVRRHLKSLLFHTQGVESSEFIFSLRGAKIIQSGSPAKVFLSYAVVSGRQCL
jgi:hypothetical protein